MTSPNQSEIEANEAIKRACQALVKAQELAERAGYGAQVLGPIADALTQTRYALDTAYGRN